MTSLCECVTSLCEFRIGRTFSYGLYEYFSHRGPDKVVLDSAEVVAPGDEEHRPDEDHADLVEDGAGGGGHLLGHGDP